MAALARRAWADRRDLAGGHENPDRPVQTAAIHAIRGDAATALEWLERGYRAGWNDARALRRDPFFQSLQRNPRFTMLLRNMSADITKMRDGVQSISDSLLQVTRDQLASSGGR